MVREGRHAQWPVGAWIDLRSGEVIDGVVDHLDTALASPARFGLSKGEAKELSVKFRRPGSKDEALKSIIRRGWIRARGQFFDVPYVTEGVLAEIRAYADKVGVWPDEQIVVTDFTKMLRHELKLSEIDELAFAVQPVEDPNPVVPENVPSHVRLYVSLVSQAYRQTFEQGVVEDAASRILGAGTVVRGSGLWTPPGGDVLPPEDAVMVEWHNLRLERNRVVWLMVHNLAESLGTLLGQSSVIGYVHYPAKVVSVEWKFRRGKGLEEGLMELEDTPDEVWEVMGERVS